MGRANPKGYHLKLREIRPHVTFDFDLRRKLTAAQKRKITQYHKEIVEAQAQPAQMYRPRSKAGRDRALELEASKSAKERKTFWIPNSGPRAKVRIRKRGISLSGMFINSRDIPINARNFVRNPKKEIDRILKGDRGKMFAIKVGKHRTLATFNRSALEAELMRYMAQYDSKRLKQFLAGVISYDFKNQKQFKQHELKFFRDRMANRRQRRGKRRAMHRGGK